MKLAKKEAVMGYPSKTDLLEYVLDVMKDGDSTVLKQHIRICRKCCGIVFELMDDVSVDDAPS